MMHSLLLKEIPFIKKIYLCPHNNNDNCDCRKPKPGMIWSAQKEFALDLSRSFLVGDRSSDIKAGQLAGINNCLFLDRNYNEEPPLKPFESIKRLKDVIKFIK